MSPNDLHISLKQSMKLGKAPIQDRFAMMKFTDHSKRTGEALSTRLNRSLAKGEDIHPLDRDMHDAIKTHAKPTGHQYDVYSGTRFDAPKIHIPGSSFESLAHISTTHDQSIAIDHAIKRRGEDGVAHVNHYNIQPHHKVVYLGGVSKHPMEYETVIPHKTKMVYTHTTYHEDHNGNPIDIHHFELQ